MWGFNPFEILSKSSSRNNSDCDKEELLQEEIPLEPKRTSNEKENVQNQMSMEQISHLENILEEILEVVVISEFDEEKLTYKSHIENMGIHSKKKKNKKKNKNKNKLKI